MYPHLLPSHVGTMFLSFAVCGKINMDTVLETLSIKATLYFIAIYM